MYLWECDVTCDKYLLTIYGAFTLPNTQTDIETETDTEINRLAKNPMWICAGFCISKVVFNLRYWLHCPWLYHPFFLNLRVFRTKIENLRWQVGGNIIWVTIGNIAISLVQNLKRYQVKKLIYIQYLDSQFV